MTGKGQRKNQSAVTLSAFITAAPPKPIKGRAECGAALTQRGMDAAP
jgi:hypothetical protein